MPPPPLRPARGMGPAWLRLLSSADSLWVFTALLVAEPFLQAPVCVQLEWLHI